MPNLTMLSTGLLDTSRHLILYCIKSLISRATFELFWKNSYDFAYYSSI